VQATPDIHIFLQHTYYRTVGDIILSGWGKWVVIYSTKLRNTRLDVTLNRPWMYFLDM